MYSILEKFKGKKIAVIGDVMLDTYLYGTVTRLSPEAPVPVFDLKESLTAYRLGGAANVAANVAALGAEVSLVGLIGNDTQGTVIKKLAAQRNIIIDTLVLDSCSKTTEKARILPLDYNQQLLRIDRGNNYFQTTDHTVTRLIINKAAEAIEKSDAVIFQDYDKGVLSKKVIMELLDVAHTRNKFIAVDPKLENFFTYRHVDLFKPNFKEASVVVGVTNMDTIGNMLLNHLPCKYAVITQGSAGMMVFQKEKGPTHVPAIMQQVFDVTGAGDTVIAVLTLAMLAGANILEAAKLATVAASIVIQRQGASTTSITEMKNRL